MENPARPSLHPMLWIAAIAVTLYCLAGLARMFGLLPSPRSAVAPQAPVSATAAREISLPAPPPAPPHIAAPMMPAPPPVATAPAPEPRHRADTYSSRPTQTMHSGSSYSSTDAGPPPR